jgi:hypothetical protein
MPDPASGGIGGGFLRQGVAIQMRHAAKCMAIPEEIALSLHSQGIEDAKCTSQYRPALQFSRGLIFRGCRF